MSTSMFSLEGKTAIVTGGNKGLGRAIAETYAAAGADIVIVSRSSAEEARTSIEALGRKCLAMQGDLISTDIIPVIMEKTLSAFGKIDILVNNAGIIRRNESLDFTEQDWDDVMNVNLKSLFFLSQAVAKQFAAQGGGGKIVSIASLLSFQGGIRIPSYTASKSGLRGLTMLLCNEWAKHNIQVNAIAPGYMITDNTEALRNDPARYKAILDRIPAERWGDPTDLSGAALFLASSASNYVNGTTIPVDGGWLAR